jgi:hypothetical protein
MALLVGQVGSGKTLCAKRALSGFEIIEITSVLTRADIETRLRCTAAKSIDGKKCVAVFIEDADVVFGDNPSLLDLQAD